MDFMIKKYKELISALKDAGYEFVTYAEYCEGRRADKLVVMRHDVDMSVERARRLAEVENEMGVKASYYFREKFIGDDVVCIASLGHEVGYHYEELVTEKGDVERAYVRFMRNVCALRELVDVKTITMHGAPTSRFDSKEMWRVYDYKKLGLIGEPQFDVDWNDMFYLTDTGRSWNGVSRRDKVAERVLAWKAKGWLYEKTDDVIRALKEGSFPNRVMMTTHPQRWADNIWEWMRELVVQRVKNVIKKLFF
jgi:hypothetical protein